jgi:hypothetical protein
MIMESDQLTTLWLGSFRYYLGRRICAVADFCRLLIKEWRSLPSTCQHLILIELTETIKRDDQLRASNENYYPLKADGCYPPGYYPLGMDIDRNEWLKVRAFIENCNV